MRQLRARSEGHLPCEERRACIHKASNVSSSFKGSEQLVVGHRRELAGVTAVAALGERTMSRGKRDEQ